MFDKIITSTQYQVMSPEDHLSVPSPAGSEGPDDERSRTPNTSGSSDMSVSSSPDSCLATNEGRLATKKSSAKVDKDDKKKARTSYTREQTQKLIRAFEENPYPDFQMYENLANDLGIPENKLKIWFQNRRARSRRKTSANTFYQPTMNPSSMRLPVTPYGFLPSNIHVQPQAFPGYFHGYPWVYGVSSPNNNQQPSSSHAALNYNQTQLQPARQHMPSVAHMTSGDHLGYLHQGNVSSSVPLVPSSQVHMTSGGHLGYLHPGHSSSTSAFLSLDMNKQTEDTNSETPETNRHSSQQSHGAMTPSGMNSNWDFYGKYCVEQ